MLSEYGTIANAQQKSKQMNSKFVLDSKTELTIENNLKSLLAIGQAIAISELFSINTQNQVSQIYSMLRAVIDKPSSIDDIKGKIIVLQRSYDNGTASK